MQYNEQLKKVRGKLKLSQAEMGGKLGITQSYYSALERGTKEITATIIDKLITDLGVSPTWFYSSNGNIFTIASNEKIGILRKKRFEESLAAEDRELIRAVRELPELTEMLNTFISIIDIDTLDSLSSIGAAWIPRVKDTVNYEHDKTLYTEAYEHNMIVFIQYLSEYKKDIIELRKTLINFLKKIEPLDELALTRLPSNM
jgi:transcriptional regulator with XRE-family HTH domain